MSESLKQTEAAMRQPDQGSGGSLRCQWCGQAIPTGAATCPSCGAAVPSDDGAVALARAGLLGEQELNHDGSLPQILADDPLDLSPQLPRPDVDPVSRMITTAVLLIGAGIAGAVFGSLVLPPLVARLFANSLGITEATAGSFRGLGVFVGLLGGMAVGAAYGAIARR